MANLPNAAVRSTMDWVILSQTAQYALRAMALLSNLGPTESFRAADLAAASGVPRDYLSKILRKLVRARLLDSVKGHRGGFRLTRAPHRIRVQEVLDAVGEDFAPRVCVFGWDKCDGRRPCPLHSIYGELADAARSWSQRTTLAELQQEK